jgi:hypothetical protein
MTKLTLSLMQSGNFGQEFRGKFRYPAIRKQREYIQTENQKVISNSAWMEDSLHPEIKIALVSQDMFNEEGLHDNQGYLKVLRMQVKLDDETTFLKEMHSLLVHVHVLQFLIVKHLVQTINHGHEVAIQSLTLFCESHSVDDILQPALLQCHFSFFFFNVQPRH